MPAVEVYSNHLTSTPVGENEPIVMPAWRFHQNQITEQNVKVAHDE
jgi:hypothetical protein